MVLSVRSLLSKGSVSRPNISHRITTPKRNISFKELFSSIGGVRKGKEFERLRFPSHDSASNFGRAHTWGSGFDGQLGNGQNLDQNSALPIESIKEENVSSISCGMDHASVVSDNGFAWCWGGNSQMQVGSDSQIVSDEVLIPEPMPRLYKYDLKQTSCGWYHTLALSKNGEVFSWGNGHHGQLGIGNLYNVCDPHQLGPLSRKVVREISCGAIHSAAVTKDGVLYTWGAHQGGQLGHLAQENQPRPLPIETLNTKVKSVSCGSFHTLFQGEDGCIYNLGTYGKHIKEKPFEPYSLKNEEAPHFWQPRVVLRDQNIVSLAAGYNTGAAVNENGELFIWTGRDDPSKMDFFKGNKLKKVALSPTHCAVISQDEDLFVWPISDFFQPSPASFSKPFYETFKQVKDVSLGWSFGLATTKVPREEAELITEAKRKQILERIKHWEKNKK